MFDLILDLVEDFHTVEVRRLHRIFGGLHIYPASDIYSHNLYMYLFPDQSVLLHEHAYIFRMLDVLQGDFPSAPPRRHTYHFQGASFFQDTAAVRTVAGTGLQGLYGCSANLLHEILGLQLEATVVQIRSQGELDALLQGAFP